MKENSSSSSLFDALKQSEVTTAANKPKPKNIVPKTFPNAARTEEKKEEPSKKEVVKEQKVKSTPSTTTSVKNEEKKKRTSQPKETEVITGSIKSIRKSVILYPEIYEALRKEAEETDRKVNYLINKILMEHYGLNIK